MRVVLETKSLQETFLLQQIDNFSRVELLVAAGLLAAFGISPVLGLYQGLSGLPISLNSACRTQRQSLLWPGGREITLALQNRGQVAAICLAC